METKKNKQGVGVMSQESVVPNDNGSINASKVGRSFHKKRTKNNETANCENTIIVVVFFFFAGEGGK